MKASRLSELVGAGLGVGGRTKGLVGSLRALIVDGRLLDGDRLPAERLLAVELGLSRSTVTAAYDQLRGEGYLIGRRGSGTYVATPAAAGSGRPDDDDRDDGAELLDLTIAVLPALPALADAAVEAAAGLPAHLSRAGLDPAGLRELRAELAVRYTARGVPTGPDQILVTSGALHAWDLLLRTFARPGAVVVTEQPTYPGVIDAALAHRVRLRPLTVDRDGWHPEDLVGAGAPVLAHVTFDGQNPTGLCAPATARRQVLAALGPDTLVAVDETMIDYASTPPGRPLPNVVSLGSASKSFWAGLRIGWIRGPASLVRRVAAVRAGQDLAPPVMDQMMTAGLLRRADELIPERRALVDHRRRALLDAIERHAPDWTVVPPAGGLSVWVDLGGGSSTQLAVRARELGIRVTPGTRFTHHGTHDQWLRLPCVLPPERVDEAVQTLARAAGNLSPARARRHSTAAAAWTA